MVALLFALSIGRPNALDREVDAISAHRLLTGSPFTLVDPSRAAAAAHLEQIRIPVWIVMVALQIGLLAWFWSAGYSARLRDRLRSSIGREFFVRFCFGALLALFDKLAAFLPQLVQYRISRLMDLTNILFRTWLLDWIIATLIAMVVAGAIAAIVLWLADRTHQWYVYTIAAVIGFTLLISYVNPYVIAPSYTHFKVYEPSHEVSAAVARVQQRTGIRVPVLEEHVGARTRLGNAFVEGWGGSQRIVLSDTLLASESAAEIEFNIVRGYAWVAANTGLHLALITGAFVVIGAALAVLISDRIGFRRDDDPVSRLALLGAILGCVYLIALPFYNGYVKNMDLIGDSAALAFTGDRSAAVRAEVRQADQALQPVCPNAFAYWYLNAHPTPGQRIALLQGRRDVCSFVDTKQP